MSSGFRTLSEATESRLSSDILRGRLAPGTRLRLKGLGEAYGVGMSPLREALARLAGRGLVVQEGQRGFKVAPVSIAELDDLTITRTRLESIALTLSIEAGSTSWEGDVLAAHHRFSCHMRSPDQLVDEVWEALHRAFHMTLLQACGSRWLLFFCGALYDQFDRYRRLAVLCAGRHPEMSFIHEELVRAALSKASSDAIQRLTEHVNEARSEILKLAGATLFDESSFSQDFQNIAVSADCKAHLPPFNARESMG